ncbi:MAG TPA: CAP domain-containing protein, partial [Anaerolineae bacterium]|nr:CAP domain-containing protein [Anaerolineae bacterium]
TPPPTEASPVGTPPPAMPPAVTPAPPPADIAAWPYETVRLMNEVRASYGLPPLTYNETLAQAAQLQATDCAQRGWCSHTGSDGSDIKQRILRVGYNPASWAECWAQRQTPQGAIDIWMDEVPPNDPHRRTLLTTWLTEVGVGVAQTTWGYYFIADFGKPR